MPGGLRHLGPWAVRGEPWPGGATRPYAVRRRHGEPLKVLRIAFRALGRKGVHRDHAYPSLVPRGEQETAALRILATSRHVPGAGGEVTVAVPLMTAPPAAGPADLVELGRRSAGRRGWQPRSAPCSASAHRLSTGACACLGPLARTLVRNINDIARSHWRASSPCSPWCPAGPARWLILTKTGPVTGTDRRKSPRRKR